MHIAERNLLHLNKLLDFSRWAVGVGYHREALKGDFEVLRLKRGRIFCIYYQHHGGQHASVSSEAAQELIKKWMRERKETTASLAQK